jgi:hypothetical protein
MNEFETQLQNFQSWSRNNIGPEFANQVDRVVSANYISQMGETIVGQPPTTPATNTVAKLADLVKSIGSTYVTTAQTYLDAKLKIEQMKTAADAERFKQSALAAGSQGVYATGDTMSQYMPLIMLGGAGLLAIMLLRR